MGVQLLCLTVKLQSTPTTPAQTTFSATQFSCRNGHLIPKRWFCDGVNDCGDRSDEPSQCSPTTSTSKTTTQSFSPKPCYFWVFTCSNGRCVDNGYRCDGQDNCGDGSDEVGCVAPTNTTIQTTTAPHCPPGWLLCAYSRSQICIKYTWLCDGIPNCPDHWDEKPENCLTSSLKVERVLVSPNSGGTSVNVHWHPITIRPPGVVFPGYRVSYRSVSLHTLPSIGDWQSKDTESTNYFIVSGLQPCSEYEFKVQVLVKGSAPGPYSDVVNTKTMTAQTSPPQNVQPVLKGVDAIQIIWEPPATYCHVITNYKVLYKEFTSITFLSVETGNILSYLLTGLTGGKTYDIKIEAYSSDGDSAPSQVQHVSISLNPPTVPVTNLRTINVTDTTVTLAWGAPQTSSGHIIPVLGYKIYKNSMEQINASGKHNYTVKSLKSKTKYTFTVRPYNRDGSGPPVNIEATTIGVSAPRNVTAVPFNLTAVVLSWKPPQFGSTSHVKYYIFYGTVNSGVSAQPMGSATKERFVVGNLQADVVYVFEVSLGLTGPHSDPAHSLTKIDFPHPPVHSLQLRIVDVTTVYLSWNGTKGNDTSIRNYKITASYNVGSESHTRTVYLVKTSYTFRYLKFNTDYTFAVQAKFNDNKLSDSVSARTKTGPFSAPVDPLIAREHTDGTVTLSWSAPRTVNLSRVHYKLYWNCPRCYYYYRRRGVTSLAGTITSYTIYSLQQGRTYFFSVHAETWSPSNVGKNATASLAIGYNVGRVQELKASVENYTMTVRWTPPKDLDAKEIKSYAFSYCNYSRASYCHHYNYGNVSKKVHQFEMAVLAGYTYSVDVYAVTPFGSGSYADVKYTVPPLSVKVSSVYSYVSGNYGLQLEIHWYWYHSYSYPNVEYEVSWHCVPSSSGSYCYWSPSYGWTTRVVNSRSLAVNVTHYDKAYKFDVVVITSRGRGEAYPLVVYIPPLNGIPGNFTCSVLKGGYYNSYLQCEWSKPTDVNPVGFYNYQLKYRCEDCIYKDFNYKYVYDLDATRANVTVSTGSRYQVSIQVSTRYGMGRSSAATVHVPSTVGRVLQLHAMVDEHIGTLVKLTWLPPRGSHPEYERSVL
ncbi:sortilin-related receptor-like [Montipora capricornis]|uniref:sortilin-related receptor-like n=1 Tax=Montipora capricornis TaxID=246305 RepID=UPI0035F11226